MNEPIVVDRNVTTQHQAPNGHIHDTEAHLNIVTYTHPKDTSPNTRTMKSNVTQKTALLRAMYAATQTRNTTTSMNGRTTENQEIINIGDGIPPRLLPDEDPFNTPITKPKPNKEQRKILRQIDAQLEQLDQQQQQVTELTGHAPRQITSTTPIHMITFNANSLAINATQDIRDNIRRPTQR